MITQTLEEFMEEGKKLFGEDKSQWVFKCVQCGDQHTIKELADAYRASTGKTGPVDIDGYIGFSCIGRMDQSRGLRIVTGKHT